MSNLLPNMDKMTALQADTCGCEDMKKREFGLDAGIQGAVVLLCKAGVETVQSCEGSDDHAYFEPTVDFVGGKGAGMYALSVCIENNLPVKELCQVWVLNPEGQILEAVWRIVFFDKVYLKDVYVASETEMATEHEAAVKTWNAVVDKTYQAATMSERDLLPTDQERETR